MASRRWLASKMEDAGLDASIDGVGNVIGMSKNVVEPGAKTALLVGSHSCTQPRGGWLDGALGVVYGLECARALAEDPSTSHLAVDAASWADEETLYHNMLGSKSFCRDPTVEDLSAISCLAEQGVTDADGGAVVAAGDTLLEALQRAGLAGAHRSRLDNGRYGGFFEAHIEQGLPDYAPPSVPPPAC
eukprot:SAG31_NODE_6383_length_2037_cov_27.616615_3_plen_188_part_00